MRASPLSRRRRLAVEQLEARDVPAGNINASLVGGVLTLRGDELGNVIDTLTVVAGSVTIDPDAGTTVNGGAPGALVTLTGTATRLAADLRSGNDVLIIAPGADFVLPLGAVVDLGDGSNNLNLSTSGKVQLGTLAVRAGDGTDSVTVRGGAGDGSRINAAATFDLGPGAGTVTLGGNSSGFGELAVPGLGGVRLTTGGGSAGGVLVGTNLTSAGAVRAATRGAAVTAVLTGSTVGGLTLSGPQATAQLSATRVNGNMTITGGFLGILASGGAPTDQVTVTGDVAVTGQTQAVVSHSAGTFRARNVRVTTSSAGVAVFAAGGQVLALSGGLTVAGGTSGQVSVGTADPSQVAGDVAVTAAGTGNAVVSLSGSPFRARNLRATSGPAGVANITAAGQALTLTGGLTVTGRGTGQLNVATSDPSQVAGDVVVTGIGAASVSLSNASFQTKNLRVQSPGTAAFSATGQAMTLTGGLTVAGGGNTQAVIVTSGLSEVAGNVTMHGGVTSAVVNLSARVLPRGNVVVNLADGAGTLVLGDGTSLMTLPGNLLVTGGDGVSNVVLNRVTVGGLADFRLGAGADTLSIESGSTFARTTFADLGTGDDTISIAQNAGALAPVTFTGKATFQAGNGNDTLRLGRSVAAGGDANSRVVFNGAGSLINGGTGVNSFDDEQGQFAGLVLGTSILNWTDPTP